jgi:hypothetical protein
LSWVCHYDIRSVLLLCSCEDSGKGGSSRCFCWRVWIGWRLRHIDQGWSGHDEYVVCEFGGFEALVDCVKKERV